jgi:hypothetical protein
MQQRGQATVEYAGICLALGILLLAMVGLASASLRHRAAGDEAALPLARRYAPAFVAERGDGEQPVDFRRCRVPACSQGARPVLYVHVVRRAGATYIEYWEYLPR